MNHPTRKSTRIPNFDYSKNQYYFVTICTQDRKCIFGSVKAKSIFGRIAEDCILKIESHYSRVKIDKYVVMPNHVHMIIIIGCDNQNGKNPNLNHVVGLYKSGVSRIIHMMDPEVQVWQRSYHDRVIRGRDEYEMIWSYIDTNPIRWDKDCYYNE